MLVTNFGNKPECRSETGVMVRVPLDAPPEVPPWLLLWFMQPGSLNFWLATRKCFLLEPHDTVLVKFLFWVLITLHMITLSMSFVILPFLSVPVKCGTNSLCLRPLWVRRCPVQHVLQNVALSSSLCCLTVVSHLQWVTHLWKISYGKNQCVGRKRMVSCRV